MVEGDAGSTIAMVPIDLSRPAPGPVVFDVASADGSAAAPGDYAPVSLQGVIQNDAALESGEDRLFSSYQVAPGLQLWIITEWDRSVTTLLLPSEY